jgi:hypothetical protein
LGDAGFADRTNWSHCDLAVGAEWTARPGCALMAATAALVGPTSSGSGKSNELF